MSETTSPTTKTTAKTSTARRVTPRRPSRHPDPATIAALAADDDDGIDYGPAIEAIDDLLGWAFALARKDVGDWPEGTRRVRNAHRYVRALLRGKTPRTEPREDLLFTAALLVRVFEAEIGLGVDQVAALLDQLGLPLDHAPAVRPVPPTPPPGPIAPSVLRHLRAIHAALPPVEAAAASDEAQRLSRPMLDAWIAALTRVSVPDGARLVSAYLRGEIEAPTPRPAVRIAPMPCAGCVGSPRHFRRTA
ncbi:MAG: hypothetical protein HS111_21985 [Kofleriaceae bacterium]|nr:hypothetical protein [Kofleriaceae bacterium]MCL4224363.1 hypothetical protein [Myxococcales bacterium]